MNLHGPETGRALLADADNITAAGSLLKSRLAHRTSREEIFTTIHALRNQGLNCSEIGRRTGFPRRSIAKWLQFETPPDRKQAALKPTSPWYFEEFLSQSWKDGCRVALKSETRRFRHRVLPLIARFGCHGAFASRPPLRNVINCGKQTWLLLESAQESNLCIVIDAGA